MKTLQFVLGVAVGVAAGMIIAKMEERGAFNELCDNVNDMASKAKKNVKNAWDKGVNEVEYVKERATYKAEEGKQKLDDMMK